MTINLCVTMCVGDLPTGLVHGAKVLLGQQAEDFRTVRMISFLALLGLSAVLFWKEPFRM